MDIRQLRHAFGTPYLKCYVELEHSNGEASLLRPIPKQCRLLSGMEFDRDVLAIGRQAIQGEAAAEAL